MAWPEDEAPPVEILQHAADVEHVDLLLHDATVDLLAADAHDTHHAAPADDPPPDTSHAHEDGVEAQGDPSAVTSDDGWRPDDTALDPGAPVLLADDHAVAAVTDLAGALEVLGGISDHTDLHPLADDPPAEHHDPQPGPGEIDSLLPLDALGHEDASPISHPDDQAAATSEHHDTPPDTDPQAGDLQGHPHEVVDLDHALSFVDHNPAAWGEAEAHGLVADGHGLSHGPDDFVDPVDAALAVLDPPLPYHLDEEAPAFSAPGEPAPHHEDPAVDALERAFAVLDHASLEGDAAVAGEPPSHSDDDVIQVAPPESLQDDAGHLADPGDQVSIQDHDVAAHADGADHAADGPHGPRIDEIHDGWHAPEPQQVDGHVLDEPDLAAAEREEAAHQNAPAELHPDPIDESPGDPPGLVSPMDPEAAGRAEFHAWRAAPDADGDQAARRIELGDYRLGNFRSLPVILNIDEIRAVSNDGSWFDAQNKCFRESMDNQATKGGREELGVSTAHSTISLEAAKAQGEAAFREAALAMLDRRFSEVVELQLLTERSHQAMRKLDRDERSLANRINRAIWGRIERGYGKEAALVAEALDLLGISTSRGRRLAEESAIKANGAPGDC